MAKDARGHGSEKRGGNGSRHPVQAHAGQRSVGTHRSPFLLGPRYHVQSYDEKGGTWNTVKTHANLPTAEKSALARSVATGQLHRVI